MVERQQMNQSFVIHLSSCMVNEKPACPYATAEEMAMIVRNKVGIPVVLGTHEYQ